MDKMSLHEKIYKTNEKVYHYLVPHVPTFDFSSIPLYWRDNSPVKTFYDNAFSISVPAFENFMIENLKEIMSSINNKALLDQITAFCNQENNHALAHEQFNERLKQFNIPIDNYLLKVDKIISKYKNIPLNKKLQLFALIETFTSVMAKYYLINSKDEQVSEEAKRLVTWHAIEELEHRCVAYDTNVYINGRHRKDLFFIVLFCWRIAFFLLMTMAKQIFRTKSVFKAATWKDLPWLFSNKGPNLMILKGMINFIKSSYDPRKYFDEKELNNIVRVWEKAFHEKNISR